MKYFNNVSDLSELRKQYKELLKKHHPDNGGNVADMQEINAEYDKLFKTLKDKHNSKATNNDKASFDNMQYDFAEDEKLRGVLEKIINFDNIEILICGQWIWVSGNTFQYKKELKEIGFKWASQKRMWYWHSEAFRKKSRKSLSMDDIRSYYGSTEIKPMQRKLLEA